MTNEINEARGLIKTTALMGNGGVNVRAISRGLAVFHLKDNLDTTSTHCTKIIQTVLKWMAQASIT
jgi:hypothetical protein